MFLLWLLLLGLLWDGTPPPPRDGTAPCVLEWDGTPPPPPDGTAPYVLEWDGTPPPD